MSVQNPFSKPEPWSVVSKGYEETTMDYLSQYAQAALSTVDLNNQATVLDVACGPGTVSRLIHSKVAKIDCLDFSEELPYTDGLKLYVVKGEYVDWLENEAYK